MPGIDVNDIHSQLNPTTVDRIVPVDSLEAIQAAIAVAQDERKPISIAGGRHAMGGQQFGSGTILLDTVPLGRILEYDAAAGLITVEAGIYWPELIAGCRQAAIDEDPQWSIAQKQTGGDRMSIGGALAANVHGRGLRMRPIIGDVESLLLVDADGNVRHCSRARERRAIPVGHRGIWPLWRRL